MNETEATVKILNKLAGAASEGEYYTNGKYRCKGKTAWYIPGAYPRIKACHIVQDGDKFFFRMYALGGGKAPRYSGFELLEAMAEESPGIRKLLAEPMDDRD